MGRLIIYTSSQNTLRGRGEKYRRVIIHLQVGEAGYSITLVQIYNALATVGPRSTGTALSAARHLAHLTNLVSWATHLYLSPEHELFQLPPPPLALDITRRRSSAACQLPKSTCYLATIMEARSFSPRMMASSVFHTSTLETSQAHAPVVNIFTINRD